jgi:hypothetical protein
MIDPTGETAVVPIGESWYRLPVSPAGFVNSGEISLYFESADCTGTPYAFPEQAAGRFVKRVLRTEGTRAYVPGTTAGSRQVLSVSDPALGCYSYGGAWEAAVVNVEWLDLSVFTPPFKVMY